MSRNADRNPSSAVTTARMLDSRSSFSWESKRATSTALSSPAASSASSAMMPRKFATTRWAAAATSMCSPAGGVGARLQPAARRSASAAARKPYLDTADHYVCRRDDCRRPARAPKETCEDAETAGMTTLLRSAGYVVGAIALLSAACVHRQLALDDAGQGGDIGGLDTPADGAPADADAPTDASGDRITEADWQMMIAPRSGPHAIND